MNKIIGQYEYVYGAGSAPNRAIKFYGDGQHIKAEVYRKKENTWQKIGDIPENRMIKEGASTTEKVRIMMVARENSIPPSYPSNKSFEKIPYAERVQTIENLQPVGQYRITISNTNGANPFFEKVEKLTFFDPT